MSGFLLSRFWLSTTTIVLVAGLVASPGLTRDRFSDWMSPGSRTGPEPSVVNRADFGPESVVAEGCVVAYPGAEVVEGSEAVGRFGFGGHNACLLLGRYGTRI